MWWLMVEEHGEGTAMTSEASDVAAVVARLGKVERELRWWRFGALGALVLLVGLGAGARGTTLEAERLVIRDAKGTVRAVLGAETESVDGRVYRRSRGFTKTLIRRPSSVSTCTATTVWRWPA
jgi:hypothetical protein